MTNLDLFTKAFVAPFVLSVGVVVLSTAQTVTVDLHSVKDNTIFQDDPFGSNGHGVGMLAGKDFSNQETRALFQFDIDDQIPSDATIVSAEVLLTMDWTNDLYSFGSENFSLHRLLASWGEGASNNGAQPEQPGALESAQAVAPDATWIWSNFAPSFSGTSWATSGGDFSPTASSTSAVTTWPGLFAWPSTPELVSDVQEMLNNPAANFGWILKSANLASAGNGEARRFSTREGLNAPILRVTYELPPPPPIPTMSQWGLILFGLLIVASALGTVHALTSTRELKA